MYSSSARSKPDNIFHLNLKSGERIDLTKSAIIYGANASGKSNIIYAIWELRKLIAHADNVKIDEPIASYKPFLFNTTTINSPTEIEITFVIQKQEKYRYLIEFNGEEIIKEALYYYPKKSKREIFTRTNSPVETDENIHIAELGKAFNNKKYSIHKKLPLLSIFGNANQYHSIISPVFTYFNELEVFNVTNKNSIHSLSDRIKSDLQKEENRWLKEKLEKLIRACDTQIYMLDIDREQKIRDIELNEDEKSIIVRRNEVLFAKHKIYNNKHVTNEFHALPFNEESIGTNQLLALGGLVLKTLRAGKVILFDELDSSLHPYIARFLLKLFLNPISNPQNAQIIFTAHEPSLMDKQMLRADQIWFTEKTEQGATELFSAQDFNSVREDIPFDKWYMEGKFGAVPHVNEIDFIFGDGQEE